MPKITKELGNLSVETNTNSISNSPKDENEPQHCTQNVSVTVNIDQKEDVLTGIFKAIARIFKKRK